LHEFPEIIKKGNYQLKRIAEQLTKSSKLLNMTKNTHHMGRPKKKNTTKNQNKPTMRQKNLKK